MANITVIGSINMDLVALVDDFPKPGQTVMSENFRTYPGGKGANQCIACARLGANVEMIGVVGSDEHGKELMDLFRSEKVCIDNITIADTSTSIAIILINKAGENQITVIPTANFKFDRTKLKSIEQIIKNTSLVVAQLELKIEIVEELIELCAKHNVPIILNPAPGHALKQEILSKVTYLTPNETELEILSQMPVTTEEQIVAAAKKLINIGVKTVIVTMGKRGAMIVDEKGERHINGFKVKAIDTVAAGDSFNGALAKCIVDGTDIDTAVRFANAVGALAVTKKGAITSIPTLAEVNDFIKKNSDN